MQSYFFSNDIKIQALRIIFFFLKKMKHRVLGFVCIIFFIIYLVDLFPRKK